MRNLFQRNRRILLLLAVLVLSFIVISTHLSEPAWERGGGFLEQSVARLVTPFQRGISTLTGLIKVIWYKYTYNINIKEKNELMAERIARLEGELARLRERAAAGERLAQLLGYKDTHDLELMVARLIGFDSAGLNRTATLDKGSSDGVRANMPVINAQGVVGRVAKVFATSCQVLLVTDFNSAIDAVVQRTRDKGIVVGQGGSMCSLKYVDRQSDILEGDAVVTSGLNAIFPSGLVIGEVASVQKDGGGLFQDIKVRPAVAAERLEEVFIVMRTRP